MDLTLSSGDFTPPNVMQFSFTTTASCSTSAGVYDANDRLIRTLWSGAAVGAGLVTRSWDGLDDQGEFVSNTATYTIKVLQNNVKHTYDGVVGNSSWRDDDHQNMHSLFGGAPTCLDANGNQVFYTAAFNEGQRIFGSFDSNLSQINTYRVAFNDFLTSPYNFAVDDQRLYFITAGGFALQGQLSYPPKTFIYAVALDVPDNNQSRTGFSSGTYQCLYYYPGPETCANPFPGMINLDEYYPTDLESVGTPVDVPSGIAVQKNGTVLAVAYPTREKIQLFDKITGVELPSILTQLIPQVLIDRVWDGNQVIPWIPYQFRMNQLAMTTAGDLWVITGPTTVAKYTNLSTTATMVTSFSMNTQDPVAIAADPTNGSIWVIDGGTNQQVKNFSAAGVLLRTLGVAGGSIGTPNLNDDQFNFTVLQTRRNADTRDTEILLYPKGDLTVDAGGNVWVSDPGNIRTLKFRKGTATVMDRITYLGATYHAHVDAGNPSRVFSRFTEYAVDYDKPLTNPDSWRVRLNWLGAIPPEWINPLSFDSFYSFASGFKNVVTLRNGRTYAQLGLGQPPQEPSGNNLYVIIELLGNGTIRQVPNIVGSPLRTSSTGIGQYHPTSSWIAYQLCDDGSIVYAITEENIRQTVYRLQLQGFDNSNNPVWNTVPEVIATAPLNVTGWERGAQVQFGDVLFSITSGGKVIFYNAIPDYAGMHLGAVNLGDTEWSWMTSPTGEIDYKGTFGGRLTNGSPNGLDYTGIYAKTWESSVIYGYHGEGYNNGQANQFYHFHESGLFISQFGVPSYIDHPRDRRIPGMIGNAFSWNLAHVAGSLYLYSNDESMFGGISRWRIDRLYSVVVQTGSGRLGSRISLT